MLQSPCPLVRWGRFWSCCDFRFEFWDFFDVCFYSYCQNLDPFFFTLSNLVYSNRGSLIEKLSFSIWSTFLVSCIFCWTSLIGWKCPTSNRVWEKYKGFIGSQSNEIELFVKSRTKSRFKLGLLSTFEP